MTYRCSIDREVEDLASHTGSWLLTRYLARAEACTARGCRLCATDVAVYRAAIALQQARRTFGDQSRAPP